MKIILNNIRVHNSSCELSKSSIKQSFLTLFEQWKENIDYNEIKQVYKQLYLRVR